MIDSHAHLDMAGGISAAQAWIEHARRAGLRGIIAIASATRPESFDENLHFAGTDAGIAVAAGVHPHEASSFTDTVADRMKRHLDRGDILAVGEIGLDYHYNHSPPARQREVFVRQLQMARAHGVPVVIHTREAEADTLSILRDECGGDSPGVIHCFSGTLQLAEGALALGFHLSFSGIVTFPRAAGIQQIAAQLPATSILVETDAPFLAPAPLRGRTNEPANVVHTLHRIAALRNVHAAVLAESTAENTLRCFRLPASWGWTKDLPNDD
jgi:TatD DNase family protein